MGIIFALGFLLFGVAIGGVGGWMMRPAPKPLPDLSEAGGTRASLGPWGELDYVPFVFSAPDEVLPVRAVEGNNTHWVFKGYTREDLEALLRGSDISERMHDELMSPVSWHMDADGIEISPSTEVVLGLEPGARKRIYRVLAQFPENYDEIYFIHKGTLHERFAGGAVSEDAMRMFRQMSCEHGDYLVFGGLSTMLRQLPAYEEKLGFLKGLTKQKTLLLRLHLTPESDLAALANYWGKGSRATDTRTMLESLSKVPGGVWLNVMSLMPPLPATRLYTFPTVPDNPLNGPAHIHDCHWTSFNFFHGTEEVDVGGNYVRNELSTHYAPATGDARYGDVLLFAKPDGKVVHSAIYLADDIVFTKNGASTVSPWMLSTIQDLIMHYSFQVPDGHKLVVSYFRRKEM